MAAALAAHPAVRHLGVEYGPGWALGRSFGVELWSTLVFLSAGQDMARLVRPAQPKPAGNARQAIDPA